MPSSRLSRASLPVLGLLALLAFAPGARASTRPAPMPAAGEIVWERIAVRAQPWRTAKRIAVFDQFRPDFRRRVVLALDVRTNATGQAVWYRISLPGRPNGRTGWVPAAGLSLSPVHSEIVIRRSRRTLELRQRGKLVLRTKVAVGAPGMETPLGLFYVTAAFRPRDSFLGAYAFETSAYSRLSEWPGGGVVGIHGTSVPQFLGQAVSHGCVRISNNAALLLKRHVRLGTPIRILR